MIHTQDELARLLNSIYPTREYKWKGAKSVADMPYMVYALDGTENFSADNRAYTKSERYEVVLYFPITSLEPEQLLEQAFDENEIFYNKSRIKASDFDLGEFSDIELYDTTGGDFYITTYNIGL